MAIVTPMAVRPVVGTGGADENGAEAPSTAAVLKALRVLDCFDGASVPLGVSELARRAGIHKSTVFRLLSYLEQSGFVERIGSSYVLGSQLLRLGRQAGRSRYSRLRAAAMPHMTELLTATQAIVLMVVEESGQAVVLAKLHGSDLADAASAIPTHSPLHSSAAGKALLAFGDRRRLGRALEAPLQRVTERTIDSGETLREQLAYSKVRGIAFDLQECVPALAGLAVPIVGDDGTADGVISLLVPPARITDEGLARALKSAAHAVGERYRRAQLG